MNIGDRVLIKKKGGYGVFGKIIKFTNKRILQTRKCRGSK
jgi:hypothetical protein